MTFVRWLKLRSPILEIMIQKTNRNKYIAIPYVFSKFYPIRLFIV